MDATAAWQVVLRNCAEQILANASQIASGEHAAEHVHQLRIGLRRLRSAIALFEHPDAALQVGAAQLFRRLGAARDQVVVESEFGTELAAALRSAGVTVPPPAASATAVDAGAGAGATPVATLRDNPTQRWLLDLLAAMQAVDERAVPAAAPPLRERLSARLNRWHRQVVADAKRYAELDDTSRHRLRKRAKRLRYATEFCAPLFGRRRVRRYLKALQAVQQRLGAVSDAMVAGEMYARRAPADPYAMFALGWLTSRRESLIATAAAELKSFTTVARFWKNRKRGG
jgi:CHAD domain-containing protein